MGTYVKIEIENVVIPAANVEAAHEAWFDVTLCAHPLRPDPIWSLRIAGWRLDRGAPGCVPWEEIYHRAGQDMLETAQRETAMAWTTCKGRQSDD